MHSRFGIAGLFISSLLILVISCGTPPDLPSFSIDAIVDTTEATIGDVINFQITVHGQGNRKIDFGNWGQDSSKIQVRSSQLFDGPKADDMGIRLEIALWDTGRIEIPGYPVIITKSSPRDSFTLYTDPVYVTVKSLLNHQGQPQLRPIKGPVAIPILIPWRTIILLILLISLIITIFTLWRRRINRIAFPTTEVIPVEPADIIALRRLENIRTTKNWDRGDYKTFYFNLTSTLKEYVENALFFKTLEMTTAEIESINDHFPFNEKLTANWIDLMTRADLVKFARQIPDTATCVTDLDFADRFIAETLKYWKIELLLDPGDSKYETSST